MERKRPSKTSLLQSELQGAREEIRTMRVRIEQLIADRNTAQKQAREYETTISAHSKEAWELREQVQVLRQDAEKLREKVAWAEGRLANALAAIYALVAPTRVAAGPAVDPALQAHQSGSTTHNWTEGELEYFERQARERFQASIKRARDKMEMDHELSKLDTKG